MNILLRPWKHYVDFAGRSRRTEYFLFFICWYAAMFVAVFVIAAIAGTGALGLRLETIDVIGPAVVGIMLLGGFLPALSVTVRRLHDQDKSGWFILLGMIPYVGGLIMLVMAFMSGTDGENQYGPDPRDPMGTTADVFS